MDKEFMHYLPVIALIIFVVGAIMLYSLARISSRLSRFEEHVADMEKHKSENALKTYKCTLVAYIHANSKEEAAQKFSELSSLEEFETDVIED